MEPFIRRILLATDFSDCAARAESWAAIVAATLGAHIGILHVLELSPGLDPSYPVNAIYLDALRTERSDQLRDTMQRLNAGGVQATSYQVVGVPSVQITAAAREWAADLIVVGTHGRTGLEHILLGSTAERVIATGPCPVLAVRAPRDAGRESLPPSVVRRILVPLDGSECSLDALEYAAQFAHAFGASMTLLHVLEPVAYSLDFTLMHHGRGEGTRERMAAHLNRMAEAIKAAGVPADFVVTGGIPNDRILEHAAGYDLVAMGTHGRRGLAHAVSGSVAESVLRHARCPVLAVKAPKFTAGHRRIVTTTLATFT